MSQHSAPNDGLREAKLIQGTNDGADDLSEWLEGIQKEHFEDETVQKSVQEESTYLEASQSTHIFNSLEELHANFEPLFQQADKSSVQSDIRKKRKFHKAFPIAAVICIIVLCMATAQAFGVNVFDAIAQWTSEQFHFSEDATIPATIGKSPLKDQEHKTYNTLDDVLNAYRITGKIAPTWSPDGFSIKCVKAYRNRENITFYIEYKAPHGTFLMMTIRNASKADAIETEKDRSKVELYKRYGIKHYLISDKTYEKATWVNGSVEEVIYGNISHGDLKHMINSVYEGK